MVWTLVAIVLGLAVSASAGPVRWLHTPVDTAVHALLHAGDSVLSSIMDLTGAEPGSRMGTGVSALLTVLLPGTICLTLVLATRAVLRTRRIIGLLLTVAGLVSHAALPTGQATLLTVVAAGCWALLSFTTGPLLIVPVLTVASALGIRTVLLVHRQDSPQVHDGVAALTSLAGGGAHGWEALLSVLAVLPVFLALIAALHRT